MLLHFFLVVQHSIQSPWDCERLVVLVWFILKEPLIKPTVAAALVCRDLLVAGFLRPSMVPTSCSLPMHRSSHLQLLNGRC